jgi:2-hydroxy-6-oxonona-2,4-dienedioate hydrolase
MAEPADVQLGDREGLEMALTDEGIIEVPGLLSRWVRLASGARAHYMTAGDSGPAVVLLHGGIVGSSGQAGWRFMAPYLGANGFRVYCPDMPGFGLADTSPEHRPTGLASYVDFVQEFATALCLDRFHLAGNSMGCANTANYVCAHPERVISFALIAGPVGDVAPHVTLTSGQQGQLFSFDGTAASMRSMMEQIIFRPGAVSDDLVDMRTRAAIQQAESYKPIPVSLMKYVSGTSDPAQAVRLSTKGRLDRCGIPGIFLYGRQDVVLPVQKAYEIEDSLPDVQFFYPDQCGHQGQTDQPEMFNEAFLEFFRDGKVRRKTAEWAGVSARRPENASLVDQPA